MNLIPLIKEIGRGAKGARALCEDDACALYGAMLDGQVPELELGAILMAYRIKGESVPELRGFLRAIEARTPSLEPPAGGVRPVVFASYNGARKQANLLPLLALLLERRGVPVLIHGVLEDPRRVTTAAILAELGIAPCSGLADAQAQIAQGRLAFLPLETISPALARLLATRDRIGLRSSAHTMAKLMDPFGGRSLRVISMTHPDYLATTRDLLVSIGATALLMRGTEGEPFASPRRLPVTEHFHAGTQRILLEQRSFDAPVDLPASIAAADTALWIRQVLDARAAVPVALAHHLAGCLVACGHSPRLEEALQAAMKPGITPRPDASPRATQAHELHRV